MKTLVLIPARNEAQKIFIVVKQVRDLGYDVLVIDDGSKDETAALAREAGAKVLSHAINRGQGAALKTGVEWAAQNEFEAVVFFDADGQMMAAEIKNFLTALAEPGVDAVLGSRFLGTAKDIPFGRLVILRLALVFTRFITGLKLTDVHNGFQAWRLDALAKIHLVQDRMAYASELLQEIADKKLNYREIPVTIEYTEYSRRKGQSILNTFNILWDLFIKR